MANGIIIAGFATCGKSVLLENNIELKVSEEK